MTSLPSTVSLFPRFMSEEQASELKPQLALLLQQGVPSPKLQEYATYLYAQGLKVVSIDVKYSPLYEFIHQESSPGVYIFLDVASVELLNGGKFILSSRDLLLVKEIMPLRYIASDSVYVVKFILESNARVPPEVVCIKGTKNRRKDTLYIGRSMYMGGWQLPASKWGNPFPVKKYGLEESLRLYREHILGTPQLLQSLHELEGHKLGCWCKPSPCHGDILVELFKTYVK